MLNCLILHCSLSPSTIFYSPAAPPPSADEHIRGGRWISAIIFLPQCSGWELHARMKGGLLLVYGTRTHGRWTLTRCCLVFPWPSVGVCVQQLRKRVPWLPTDAFDCRRLPEASLLIASTAQQQLSTNVFFSSHPTLSCLPHHLPLRLSICWHSFKIRKGRIRNIIIVHTKNTQR